MKIYILLLSIILCLSCSSAEKQNDPFGDAKSHKIGETTANIRLPKTFKRSSKYRMKEDIPALSYDSITYNSMIRILERNSFEKNTSDLFVDTSSILHFIHIVQIEHTPLNKTNAAMLKGMINTSYRTAEEMNANLSIVEEGSNIQSNNNATLLRFKHHIKNWSVPDDGFYSNYFVYTTKSNTYIISEVREDNKDHSRFLWSIVR